MSDTVKLIIEIPKNYYEIIKREVDHHISDYRPFVIIANGTPFDSCEDCISRESILNAITEIDDHCNMDIYTNEVRELVNDLPSIQPNLSVIDDIKAEIKEERECAYADFEQYKIDYLGVDAEYVEDELPSDDFRYGMERCLEIIDKHIPNHKALDKTTRK